MLHVSRYDARLAKERRKKEDEQFCMTFELTFRVCHFKIVTIHVVITTADWGKFYKLFCVLLDASICSPAMISPCKR